MDSVVSNFAPLRHPRLSRSPDLTQGRRDAKLRWMRPRFSTYARRLPLATTETSEIRGFQEAGRHRDRGTTRMRRGDKRTIAADGGGICTGLEGTGKRPPGVALFFFCFEWFMAFASIPDSMMMISDSNGFCGFQLCALASPSSFSFT